MVELSKKEAVIVKETLEAWQKDNLLSVQEVNTLKASIKILSFNWHKIAKYCFWIAIIAILISISSLIADEAIRRIFQEIFTAPASIKCLTLSILAASLYALGYYWQQTRPDKAFTAEAILFFGVFTTMGAVYQLGLALDTGSGHFSILLLLSFIIESKLSKAQKLGVAVLDEAQLSY